MKEYLENVEKEQEMFVDRSEQMEPDENHRFREFIAKKWHEDL